MRRGVILFLLCLFVLGCGGSSGGGGSSPEAGEGTAAAAATTFRIQLPAVGPQQVLAQEVRIERVTVAVSSDGSVVRTGEANVAAGQTTVEISVPALPPGDYTIRVDGFQGATLLATDTAQTTLTAEESVTVTLTLTFVVPLSIDPTAFSLTPGNTQQLTASRGTTPVTAVWASEVPAIATVDQNGLVTAQAVGQTNITATENGETVASVATVNNVVVLNSIDILPLTSTIAPGGTQAYMAQGNFSDGSTPNITATVQWNSSDTNVATIVNGGVATGQNDGVTTITATQDGVTSNDATLNVVSTPVLVSLLVTPDGTTNDIGETRQFTATGTFSSGPDQDLTNDVTWTTAPAGLADIDATGEGDAMNAGIVTVTATLGAISDDVTWEITGAAPTLVDLRIEPLADTIVAGGAPLQFTATAIFSDMSEQIVTTDATWSSSNTAAATIVPTTGLATGNNAGVADIGATFGGINRFTPLTVFDFGIPFSTVITTATDPGFVDDYVLPDVAVDGTEIMVVKANSSTTAESHVLLQRFTAFSVGPPFIGISSSGPLVDFGGNGSLVLPTALPFRQDRAPSVTMNADTTNNVAVAYQDDVGIRGRRFTYGTNPAGTGTLLSTGTAERNPSVSMNTPNAAMSIVGRVVATFAEDFPREFIANFALGTPLADLITVTAGSTNEANDVASSLTNSELAVRTWIDNSTPPGVVRYQVFDGNTPVGAIRNVQAPLGTDFQGEFREVSVSMYRATFGGRGFVIVFDEEVSPGTDRRVHMATFDQFGNQLIAARRFNAAVPLNFNPDVATINEFSPSFYVVWKEFASAADTTGRTVIQRFKYPNGDPHPASASGGFRLSAPMGAPGTNLDPPAVAVNETGEGVVVWASKLGAQSDVFLVTLPFNADLNF